MKKFRQANDFLEDSPLKLLNVLVKNLKLKINLKSPSMIENFFEKLGIK